MGKGSSQRSAQGFQESLFADHASSLDFDPEAYRESLPSLKSSELEEIKELVGDQLKDNKDKLPRGVLGGERVCFSVTELETYLRCPYGWLLQNVVKPPFKPSYAAYRGNIAHIALAEAFKTDKAENRLERAREVLAKHGEKFESGELERLETRIYQVIKNYGSENWPFKTHLLETSLKANNLFPGLPEYELKGKADRIDLNDTEVLVIDYKSRLGAPKSYALQSSLYPLLAARTHNRTPIGALYISLSEANHYGCMTRSLEGIDNGQVELEWQALADTSLLKVSKALVRLEAGQVLECGKQCPRWCMCKVKPLD